MATLLDPTWTCRGMALLWDVDALLSFCTIPEVITIRQLFLLNPWPEDLPSNNGRALVVAGLDACLDALSPAEAEIWIEEDLKNRILQFQDEYENQAALIFWLPAGRSRLSPNRASGSYLWRCDATDKNNTLQLGKRLWAGAEPHARRILKSEEKSKIDPDGTAWIGLHHPRIS